MDRRILDFIRHPIHLEIGCGFESPRREKYIGLDIVDFGQEIVWDAEQGIPLPDNSCREIFSQHTFEHFENPIGVFNECWRILTLGGIMEVIVPHHTRGKAFGLHHARLWSLESFKYLSRDDYGDKKWKILELVKNEKPDIYCRMGPIK